MQGDFHLFFDIGIAGIYQKLQAGIFFFQIGKKYNFWLVIGTVHVVDMELTEIADHNPAGILVVGQIPGIPAGLSIGRQNRTIRLLGPSLQIHISALLLNQNAGFRDETINKAGVI